MTVKEAIEYIISKSKDDESLLTDTKRFGAFLSDLAPEYKEKGLNVIKRSLDSEFLNLCFKDKDDVIRRVSRMKYRLEKDGVSENWIDFIIDSFFSPLGWTPPKDEEETSQTQPQQTQKQQTQKQQTHNQQTQNQQTQNQQTQNQQTQNQQTQNQQTQNQQTQNQQTQNQQTQNQQTQNQQTQNQQTQNQQNVAKWGVIAILIFIGIGICIFTLVSTNSNKNDIKVPTTYSTETINKEQVKESVTQFKNQKTTENNNSNTEKIRKTDSPFATAKVGDYIKLGSYSQTSTGDVKPIEWLVLSKEENKMLVISKYALIKKSFDSYSNDWKNSEIRKWLNGAFYNKVFNTKEKKYIILSNLSDVGTSDNIFLLSKAEAEKYFANNNARRCKPTEYAKKNGAWVYDGRFGGDAGYSIWLLRSPSGNDMIGISSVSFTGSFGGAPVKGGDIFVIRPALWINF